MTPGNYFVKILYRQPGVPGWRIIPTPDSVYNRANITVSGTTSLDKIELQNLINVYPNPAESSITLNLNGVKAHAVQLVNIQGQKVWNADKIDNVMQVSVGHLANGIYLLQIKTDRGLVAKKVVIRH